jgi:RND superfamily putative drug exporter
MDYEIFFVSRVREEHLAGAPNDQAIVRALKRSARPITLAALTIMTVFLSAALARVETFRQLGVGMALAVFLDATLVRCALVPAALVLLGERNWWMPRFGARRSSPGTSPSPAPSPPAPEMPPRELAGETRRGA